MFFKDFYFALPETFPSLQMTSIYFVIFVFILFILSRSFKAILRPYVLLIADIIFILSFGIYDLWAIICISLFGYCISLALDRNNSKYILAVSLALIACVIILFKYGQFIYLDSLVMPFGLSFYTFKVISYLVDVYKGKIENRVNPIYYFNYILFFPTITAGPINRAKSFIEELDNKREFNYIEVKNGAFLMVLGIFEKLVFCDFIALWTNNIFNTDGLYGINLIFGLFLYSFQIYLDFDAVSNIAIGTAKVFGFDIQANFNSPYLAKSLKEFWKRWHISLSSWLKDYIYIPLGGSRINKWRTSLNLIITFLVSGMWHGATINFILWGLGHALIQIVENMIGNFFKKFNFELNRFGKIFLTIFGIISNFVIVSLLWLVFRFNNMTDVINYIKKMFIMDSFNLELINMTNNQFIWLIVILVCVIVLDILRNKFDLIKEYSNLNIILRWFGYIILIVVFMIFGVYGGSFNSSDFIYQFF